MKVSLKMILLIGKMKCATESKIMRIKQKRSKFKVDTTYYIVLLESNPSITPIILKKETEHFYVFQMDTQIVRLKKDIKFKTREILDDKSLAEAMCKKESLQSINHAIKVFNYNRQTFYSDDYWLDLINTNLLQINTPSLYYRDFISF